MQLVLGTRTDSEESSPTGDWGSGGGARSEEPEISAWGNLEPWAVYRGSGWGLSGSPGDFSGGPVVKASLPNTGGACLIPGQGAKTPHASWARKPKHETEAVL